jgi:hypothetical protein
VTKATAKQFMRVLQELEELDEAFSTRTMDPEKLYKPFNPQDRVDYTPQRSRHAQTVSLNDLYQAAERGARSLGAVQCQVSRWLGEGGFLMTCSVLQGNFQGQPIPSAGAIQSAVTQELLRTYPSATVDLIDVDQLSSTDPTMFRRRVHLRIRRGPTVSEVRP